MSQYQQYNSSNNPPEFNLKKYRPIIFTLLLLIVGIVLISKSVVILEPTERGVIFYKWGDGLDTENVYGEGLNMVAPWNEMIIFEVAEQQQQEEMVVLSADGLTIKVEVSVRYRPTENGVGLLYKQFQQDYHERLVIPELRSAVRTVIGNYQPEELYSTKRSEIELAIDSIVSARLDENHVLLTAMLLRKIELPQSLQGAIEEKLTAEQHAQRYVYILQQERQEAERKIVEARGAATANAILDSSLTGNLLKMRGIEATLKLSESPNSKVVVVGGGEDGLPLILGNN